jgi:molybdenum cofactor cytidylyltransferase
MPVKRPVRLQDIFRLEAGVIVSIVGAGGKTSTCFRLAQSFQKNVVITTTTHVGVNQFDGCAEHYFVNSVHELDTALSHLDDGPLLLTGNTAEGGTYQGLEPVFFAAFLEQWRKKQFSILIEADGAKSLALKAPADHEPCIPPESQVVIVVAGCQGLGKPLDVGTIHRTQQFQNLSGINLGETVSPEVVLRVILHPQGGMKNIPPKARKILLFNQADTPNLQAIAGEMAKQAIQNGFDAALIASLDSTRDQPQVYARFEPVFAAVVLDGEKLSKLQPEQIGNLVERIHSIEQLAAQVGCDPFLVVDPGSNGSITEKLKEISIKVIPNSDWKLGKSTGYHQLMRAISTRTGAVLLFDLDQPEPSRQMVEEMFSLWQGKFARAVRPLIAGRRSTPILFDQSTFSGFARLQGDQGIQALINLESVEYLTWQDESGHSQYADGE